MIYHLWTQASTSCPARRSSTAWRPPCTTWPTWRVSTTVSSPTFLCLRRAPSATRSWRWMSWARSCGTATTIRSSFCACRTCTSWRRRSGCAPASRSPRSIWSRCCRALIGTRTGSFRSWRIGSWALCIRCSKLSRPCWRASRRTHWTMMSSKGGSRLMLVRVWRTRMISFIPLFHGRLFVGCLL